MTRKEIKQMVGRLQDVAERNSILENTSLYSAAADMIELLMTESEDKSIILTDYKARLHRMDDQLADCKRELEAERERRFEGNRISSEEHAAEIEQYKSLCDQMGNALELMLKSATHYGEAWAKCYVADYERVAIDSKEMLFKLLAICRDKLQAVPEALEAWRAMK